MHADSVNFGGRSARHFEVKLGSEIYMSPTWKATKRKIYLFLILQSIILKQDKQNIYCVQMLQCRYLNVSQYLMGCDLFFSQVTSPQAKSGL